MLWTKNRANKEKVYMMLDLPILIYFMDNWQPKKENKKINIFMISLLGQSHR